MNLASILSLPSLPIDDDVLHRILTSLSAFVDLQSFILTSKSIYVVFDAHPHSIVRAVAYNVIGPALPQALRVVRQQPVELKADVDPFDPEAASVSIISPAEAIKLTEIAQVICDLEDLFSWRHKDRTSRISKLSASESWRFSRALARIMHYAVVFPGQSFNDLDDPDDDDEMNEIRAARQKYLQHLTSEELLDIERVVSFLADITYWAAELDGTVMRAEWLHFSDMALSIGPAVILESYQQKSTDPILHGDFDLGLTDVESDFFHGYITDPLRQIFEERKVVPPNGTEDYTQRKIVLDSINGGTDECQQCHAVCGTNLWNETNWDFVGGVIPPSSLTSLLMGQLQHNPFDRNLLDTHVRAMGFRSLYPSFIGQLFDCKTAAFDAWKKEDWICQSCLTLLIRSHLHVWLLEYKQRQGLQINEDCWYGYNCRTQTHRAAHAQRLNHLCTPTKGG